MSNPRKRLDFFLAVLLSSGQEDKKSAYEFVHQWVLANEW
jgi:hypothetical protein